MALLVILLFSGGMMGFGMGFGAFMLFFWGAVIWLVISLMNAVTRESEEIPESPYAILKKRYARGEISRERYREMENELMR